MTSPVSTCWRLAGLTVGLLACLPVSQPLRAQSGRIDKDLVYATVDGKALSLDLYLPPSANQRPLLVWVHGGAWNIGTKASVPAELIQGGLAVASVDFRQASEARFPAQVHDIKAAVRFLRAKSRTYGYRADRIVIGGASSGAHLAALVGVTNGHRELEGSLGEFLGESSAVQGIADYYGASNLRTILPQSTPFGLNIRRPALERLLGGLPDQVQALAELASPVAHIDRTDPPLLLFHGDQDPQMPINQAHELQGAYEQAGLPVEFHVVHGAAHGGDVFFAPPYLKALDDFLSRIPVR